MNNSYEFLKAMGKNVHLAGNIGLPLSKMVSDIKENDIIEAYVVEEIKR